MNEPLDAQDAAIADLSREVRRLRNAIRKFTSEMDSELTERSSYRRMERIIVLVGELQAAGERYK